MLIQIKSLFQGRPSKIKSLDEIESPYVNGLFDHF